REELAELIENGQWDKLLRRVPVKPGDFLYVPRGTIHAIGKGIMVLETQQSSDTTYRVYDFDRVDKTTGQKRELHIQQSIDVTNRHHVDTNLDIKDQKVGDAEIRTFVEKDFFIVYRWRLEGGEKTFTRKAATYTLVYVLKGQGQISVNDKSYEIEKCVHF